MKTINFRCIGSSRSVRIVYDSGKEISVDAGGNAEVDDVTQQVVDAFLGSVDPSVDGGRADKAGHVTIAVEID